MATEGPVSTKANVRDLASSVDLAGKRVFVRVSVSHETTRDTRHHRFAHAVPARNNCRV